MTAEKLANILFTSCFVVFLGAVMIITIIKPKESVSYYENRELASIPHYSYRGIVEGTYFSSWNDFLSDHSAGRKTLVKLNAYIDANLINRPVVNDVVISDDMLLGFEKYELVDKKDIAKQSQEMANNMSQLNKIIQSYGGSFYYVAVPGQYSYFGDRYPFYLNNRKEYTDAVLAAFKSDMGERDVRLIDMGDVFKAIGNPSDLYSKADYHYSYRGAFKTYQSIMEVIGKDANNELSILKETDLEFRTLDNPYMGSRLRKICNVRQSREKLEIGLPIKAIPFTRTDNDIQKEASVYALPTNSWENITYSAYMGGDVSETIIDTGRTALPSVLIYGDSFTNPIETLLYYSFDVMYSIDLRGYKNMSLAEYIQRYKPDFVVCVRDYEVLLSTDGNGNVF